MDKKIGLSGQVSNSGLRTIKNYDASEGTVYYGRALQKVISKEIGSELLKASDGKFLGISVRNEASSKENYSQGHSVPVMKMGSIYVEVEESVTPDDPVYARFDGKLQIQTITFDADFVASNKINGFSVSEVSFDTDHATTISALATALKNLSEISDCTASGRVLTITGSVKGLNVEISNIVVSGGASQAGSAVAETVKGIALAELGKFRKDSDGTTAVELTGVKFSENSVDGLVELDVNII
ncbi:MAG: hypothetical protein GY817_04610 [bacterium]|nr:hypothetical protein [bacterium]